MRSGQPLSHPISFASGFPDANVAWQVHDTAGLLVESGTVTPAVGAISDNINIAALSNTLSLGQLLGSRDLTWTYLVGGVTVSGSYRYQIEGVVPFLASEKGVRNMLGIDDDDSLSDEDIALLRGYLQFEQLVGAAALATKLSGTSYEIMLISEAIEAQAALRLIPTLQVRIAKRETSGTNQYDRGDIDWGTLEASLAAKVTEGAILVNSTLDLASPSTSALLVLVTPSFDLFPDG